MPCRTPADRQGASPAFLAGAILSYDRSVPDRLSFPLRAIARLLCTLIAVVALGGQIATASESTDRLASTLAAAGNRAAAVLCGKRQHATIVRTTPPSRPLRSRLVWVTSSAADASDLLAPDQPGPPRPERPLVRSAAPGPSLRGPPDTDGARPYPRAPPIPG